MLTIALLSIFIIAFSLGFSLGCIVGAITEQESK